MRPMKRSRIQTMLLFSRTSEKDSEGGTYESFATTGTPFRGEQWPAGGQVQAEMYGEKLAYMRNVKIKGNYTKVEVNGVINYVFDGFSVCELDGIGIEKTDEPDYQIISIKPYYPLLMEVRHR